MSTSETTGTPEQSATPFREWDFQHDDLPPGGDYYGNCPVCGSAGLARDVGNWIVIACDDHRICWEVGNSFGRLRDAFPDMSREDLERAYAENRAELRGYREIDPNQAIAPSAWRTHDAIQESWKLVPRRGPDSVWEEAEALLAALDTLAAPDEQGADRDSFLDRAGPFISGRSDKVVLALLYLQRTRLVAAEPVLRRRAASDRS